MKLLRDDLIIYPAEDGSNKFFAKDPSTNELFEFGEKEYYLINEIKRPYNERVLLAKYNAKFGEEETPAYISGMINRLDELDLLKDDSKSIDAAESRKKAEVSPKVNFFHLFRPEKILDGICHLLYPLRYLVWLIPLLLVFSLAGILFNWQEVIDGIATAKAYFGLIGRLIFVVFTVNFTSQLFKGVVARHYGLQVPSFGIMLILGLYPRFKIQVALSPGMTKADRLYLTSTTTLVHVAMFELGIILWLVNKASGTFLATIGAELAFVSVLGMMFVTNPLWGGDGYAFLAALVGMPDLKQRAKNALRGVFSRRPDVIKKYSKDTFALVLYGFLSLTFMVALSSILIYIFATRLESQYRGAGVALFLVLLTYVVHTIRRKAKSKISSRKMRSEKAGQGDGSRGKGTMLLRSQPSEAYFQVKESKNWHWKKYKWRYVFLVLFVICMFLPYKYEAGGDAEIFPIAQRDMYAETDGVIKEVFFEGGEWVAKGTVIAQMDKHRQEKDVDATRLLIQGKQKDIDKLRTTPSKESVNLALELLESAKVKLKYSTDEFSRLKTLYEKELISLQDFENAREKMEVDKQSVSAAQASLEALKAQVNPNEIESAEAELQRLKEDLKYYEEQLRLTSLRTSIDGRITTMKIKDLQNKYLEAGMLFARIEDTHKVRVEIAVPESDILGIGVGYKVQLKTWSNPGHIFRGTVSEISPTTTSTTTANSGTTSTNSSTKSGEVVKVISIIPNGSGELKTGLTGYAKIEGDRTIVLQAFTRAVLRFIQIEAWSWIP